MSVHPVFADEQRRATNITAGRALCDYCGGTGNEFYAMYRACPKCGGSGAAALDREGEG